ncbi:hypothetical protein K469DRAFT_696334, partial [Zopfia rhizophila CBS 207.26]
AEAGLDASAAYNTSTKSLSERVTAPNAQPKKVTAEKPSEKAAAAARGGKANARGRGHTARGGRNARPKKKTAAELDAEMTDYFGGGGEAAAAAAADDLGMDERTPVRWDNNNAPVGTRTAYVKAA